ncbi:hypothetical protein B6A42_27600 (plasmid) [Vibrio coralliilyticus]|nr:hypothetical protein B6A42_27600 [Vibrio coralliilyticus]
MKDNRLETLHEQLKHLPGVSVAQIYEDTNSVGLSFDYLGVTYTTYLDAQTGIGELLRHNPEDVSQVQKVGAITSEALIGFFDSVPKIESIAQ